MKTPTKNPGEATQGAKVNHVQKAPEIKTDIPLSEKDEVKKAEEKMRKAAKK